MSPLWTLFKFRVSPTELVDFRSNDLCYCVLPISLQRYVCAITLHPGPHAYWESYRDSFVVFHSLELDEIRAIFSPICNIYFEILWKFLNKLYSFLITNVFCCVSASIKCIHVREYWRKCTDVSIKFSQILQMGGGLNSQNVSNHTLWMTPLTLNTAV
jgi:hypothetical protein